MSAPDPTRAEEIAPPAGESEREAQFVSWMRQESQRREVARLKRRLLRLFLAQLAAYALILFWVGIMFVGYRLFPALVSADLAAIVTFMTLAGGALIVWHLRRMTAEAERRLEAEQRPASTGAEEG